MRATLHKRDIKRTIVMSRDGLVNLVWHGRLRKICNGCIIQRKEKVSWRKEETRRAKSGE